MNDSRSFWITGAGNGLGLALVERLLENGHRVAASGKECDALDALGMRHGSQLLRLPWQLHEEGQASRATEQICHAWCSLDVLIINAGTSDYLAASVPDDQVLETIVNDNQLATEHCLNSALPLLKQGYQPQVMVVFNRYSALQLYSPTQVTSGWNSAVQWTREQRANLKSLGIDLTVVAPQSLKTPVTPVKAAPSEWTPQSAADELLTRLPLREPELVLEVMDISSLWPLSR